MVWTLRKYMLVTVACCSVCLFLDLFLNNLIWPLELLVNININEAFIAKYLFRPFLGCCYRQCNFSKILTTDNIVIFNILSNKCYGNNDGKKWQITKNTFY